MRNPLHSPPFLSDSALREQLQSRYLPTLNKTVANCISSKADLVYVFLDDRQYDANALCCLLQQQHVHWWQHQAKKQQADYIVLLSYLHWCVAQSKKTPLAAAVASQRERAPVAEHSAASATREVSPVRPVRSRFARWRRRVRAWFSRGWQRLKRWFGVGLMQSETEKVDWMAQRQEQFIAELSAQCERDRHVMQEALDDMSMSGNYLNTPGFNEAAFFRVKRHSLAAQAELLKAALLSAGGLPSHEHRIFTEEIKQHYQTYHDAFLQHLSQVWMQRQQMSFNNALSTRCSEEAELIWEEVLKARSLGYGATLGRFEALKQDTLKRHKKLYFMFMHKGEELDAGSRASYERAMTETYRRLERTFGWKLDTIQEKLKDCFALVPATQAPLKLRKQVQSSARFAVLHAEFAYVSFSKLSDLFQGQSGLLPLAEGEARLYRLFEYQQYRMQRHQIACWQALHDWVGLYKDLLRGDGRSKAQCQAAFESAFAAMQAYHHQWKSLLHPDKVKRQLFALRSDLSAEDYAGLEQRVRDYLNREKPLDDSSKRIETVRLDEIVARSPGDGMYIYLRNKLYEVLDDGKVYLPSLTSYEAYRNFFVERHLIHEELDGEIAACARESEVVRSETERYRREREEFERQAEAERRQKEDERRQKEDERRQKEEYKRQKEEADERAEDERRQRIKLEEEVRELKEKYEPEAVAEGAAAVVAGLGLFPAAQAAPSSEEPVAASGLEGVADQAAEAKEANEADEVDATAFPSSGAHV